MTTAIIGRDIRVGDKFVVLADARYSSGSQEYKFPTGTLVTADRNGVDSDGDAHVAVDGDRDGEAGYIYPRYLARRDDVADAPKVGDTVEVYKNVEADKYLDDRDAGKIGVVDSIDASFTTPIAELRIAGQRDRFSVYLPNIRKVAAAPLKVGDRVKILNNRFDSDGWTRRAGQFAELTRLSGVGGTTGTVRFESGGTSVCFLENLEAAPVQTVTVRDAFKTGNTIQFSVDATIDDRVTVGCKNPLLSAVTESLVSMDRTAGKATFTAEVTERNGYPEIYKHGVRISYSDALDYFKDVKILATKARENVKLEITADQADALRDVLGSLQTGSVLSPVYRELADNREVKQGTYRLTVDGRASNGSGSWAVSKR